MQEKELIENIKFYKSNSLNMEISQLSQYIRSLTNKGKEFYLKVYTGQKTHPQLKAFYSARDQLLPQYNQRERERGESIFCKEQFKYALKIVGKWHVEKNNHFIPKDMMEVLDNIDKWAMIRGFSLSISRELMDLIK
jgi:hypothetical protein